MVICMEIFKIQNIYMFSQKIIYLNCKCILYIQKVHFNALSFAEICESYRFLLHPSTHIQFPSLQLIHCLCGAFVVNNSMPILLLFIKAQSLSLGPLYVVHSASLDKCITTANHYWSILQHNFTALKFSLPTFPFPRLWATTDPFTASMLSTA